MVQWSARQPFKLQTWVQFPAGAQAARIHPGVLQTGWPWGIDGWVLMMYNARVGQPATRTHTRRTAWKGTHTMGKEVVLGQEETLDHMREAVRKYVAIMGGKTEALVRSWGNTDPLDMSVLPDWQLRDEAYASRLAQLRAATVVDMVLDGAAGDGRDGLAMGLLGKILGDLGLEHPVRVLFYGQHNTIDKLWPAEVGKGEDNG